MSAELVSESNGSRSSFRKCLLWALFGAAATAIIFLIIDDGDTVIPCECPEGMICIEKYVEKDFSDPAPNILHYAKWAETNSFGYGTKALNIPADVVHTMFQYLKANPTDSSGADRPGVRIYYASSNEIDAGVTPDPAETMMVVWLLDSDGNPADVDPSSVPQMGLNAGYELPCPSYCDSKTDIPDD